MGRLVGKIRAHGRLGEILLTYQQTIIGSMIMEQKLQRIICRLGGGWNLTDGGHFKGMRRADARGPHRDHYDRHRANRTPVCNRGLEEKRLWDKAQKQAAREQRQAEEEQRRAAARARYAARQQAADEVVLRARAEQAATAAPRPEAYALTAGCGAYVLTWRRPDVTLVYVGEGRIDARLDNHEYIRAHGPPDSVRWVRTTTKEDALELEQALLTLYRSGALGEVVVVNKKGNNRPLRVSDPDKLRALLQGEPPEIQ